MFFYRSPKTALKNTQNSPLYTILKLTFPEIFKNESFCFSQFSRNFIFLNNVHFMAQATSGHVSPPIPKNRTQKCSKLTSPQHFEIDIPENFQK